jgi:hypothetical protein
MSAGAAIAVSQVGAGIGQGLRQAEQIKTQADLENRLTEVNAQTSLFLAEDAVKRGKRDAQLARDEIERIVGTQKAGFAAQNVQTDTGSALAVVEDTRRIGASEVAAIKVNALREAFVHKGEALGLRLEGRLRRISSRAQAKSLIASGGIGGIQTGVKTADKFGAFEQDTGGPSGTPDPQNLPDGSTPSSIGGPPSDTVDPGFSDPGAPGEPNINPGA